MPEIVLCPQCRRALEMRTGLYVREVSCVGCQHVFRVGCQYEELVGAAASGITAEAPSKGGAVQTGLPDSAAGELRPWEKDKFDVRATPEPFRPGGTLATAVKVLIGLSLLLTVITLSSTYLQYKLCQRLLADEKVPQAELKANDARQEALGLGSLPLLVVCGIVFLGWFYRAYANLPALGASNLAYTPGWAVGCWFVPFLNLWRPVQIAQEIWRKSNPTGGPESGSSVLIGLWWVARLLSIVLGHVARLTSQEVRSPATLADATVALLVSDIAELIAALLALAVVSRIDARQAARAEALRVPVSQSESEE
jgi:hypothetical protein